MVKKVAAIHDLSGIGRCSLTAAIPIISALKVQCCPLPTAILSSQTGYPKFTFLDFTDEMTNYYKTWNELNINFDCIYSGFLGSIDQVDIVSNFINLNKNSFVIIDPVMGDNGELYSIFSFDMCNKIKDLVKLSNLTTPNITEACFLTDRDLSKKDYSDAELISIAKDISLLGPDKVVITGIIKNDEILNLAYDKITDKHFFTSVHYNNCSYSGTGDIFTSILCGLLTNGYDFKFSVEFATNFIFDTIEYTHKYNTDPRDGVMFEAKLNKLTSI